MSGEEWERRPEGNPSGFQEVPLPTLSVPRCGRSGIHPDTQNRRPVIPPDASPAELAFAAKFSQLEKAAVEIVEYLDAEHLDRASGIYELWAQRYAELNDPDQARECHGIAIATKQRAELIRMYPGEFSDVLAIMADVWAENSGA